MAHCRQCKWKEYGCWCYLKNRETTTKVCAEFEMSWFSKIVSKVKRAFANKD